MMDEHPWMSKDLLVRLRWWAFKFCGKGEQENFASDAMSEAASRIEKLEAALQAIIKRAEFRNSEYVTDAVCSIARDALEGKDG